MVALSDKELAQVRVASVREGLSSGAWLGEVGVRAADAVPGPAVNWGPTMQQLMVLREELMAHRSLLRNIGGNLNDVARHANSTGEVHQATLRVEEIVARAVRRVEESVERVGKLTELAREELRGSRR